MWYDEQWMPKILSVMLPLGSTDGSLKSLTPVDEATAKRLQLLQGQLTRNIQHVAGLNPKALRSVQASLCLRISRLVNQGLFETTLYQNHYPRAYLTAIC
jgi:cleavage and polyadenylation specificity factor subunit 1